VLEPTENEAAHERARDGRTQHRFSVIVQERQGVRGQASSKQQVSQTLRKPWNTGVTNQQHATPREEFGRHAYEQILEHLAPVQANENNGAFGGCSGLIESADQEFGIPGGGGLPIEQNFQALLRGQAQP
jgi:hypothetical protein